MYPVSVKGRLQTADCGPGVKCRLSIKCRLQTESETQVGCIMQNEDYCRLGVKCRPSINCSLFCKKCKRSLTSHLLSQIHSFSSL